MRVVVAGSHPPPGWESWRPDVVDGFRQLGHHVTEIPTWNLTPDLIRTAHGADLLLWLRHQKIRLDNTAVTAALRTLEAAGTVTAGLHMDLYQNARRHLIGNNPWWRVQHVFTTEGGEHGWRGVNHHTIAPACGTRFVGPGTTQSRYQHKACFTGTVNTAIHGQHRSDLIAWAKHTYRDGFAHYENKRNPVHGQDLTDLYTSTALVLADSGISHGPHWADRVPKTLIRGGILQL